jgi:hypothetical protein
MTMLDADLVRIRAHRNNVQRYRRLLRTRLSDLERQFIERRLAEEAEGAGRSARRHIPNYIRLSESAVRFRQFGSRAMSDLGDLLIHGSEKIVGHHRLLLAPITRLTANSVEAG